MRNLKPILLVEDDQVDAMTIKRAFSEVGIKNELIHKTDGEDALEYLKNQDSKKPCIILLDLTMPKMSGLEFLHIVKSDEYLKIIPIIILTTSDHDRDIVESFEFSVAGYMVKTKDYQDFIKLMEEINHYWSISELPLRY